MHVNILFYTSPFMKIDSKVQDFSLYWKENKVLPLTKNNFFFLSMKHGNNGKKLKQKLKRLQINVE